jgi:hypothetical protein
MPIAMLLLTVALQPGAAASPAPSAKVEVKLTQRHLVALCRDGAAVDHAERSFRLSLAEHSLAFSMRPDGAGEGDLRAGIARVRFTPEAGHRYEVEVRAPVLSFSSQVWKPHDWTPVVRDRTLDRIVSGAPEWSDGGCR